MKWLIDIPVKLVRRPSLLFALWALWLSAEYWALGDFSYLFIHDNADQIIPVSTWLTESPKRLFTESLLPEMSGVDRFATTAWVNLHRLFCLVMPAWLAHGLFIFVQRFVAGYFTCRLLREAFSVPPVVSILAGAAYTMISLEHGEMRLMHNLNEPFPIVDMAAVYHPADPIRCWRAGCIVRWTIFQFDHGAGWGMAIFLPHRGAERFDPPKRPPWSKLFWTICSPRTVIRTSLFVSADTQSSGHDAEWRFVPSLGLERVSYIHSSIKIPFKHSSRDVDSMVGGVGSWGTMGVRNSRERAERCCGISSYFDRPVFRAVNAVGRSCSERSYWVPYGF